MKQTTIRIITGLIIISIGVGAFLGALNAIPFWETFRNWWPALVILGGIFVLIGDLRRNYIWGSLLVVIGAVLLMKQLGYVEFNVFSLIVPSVIIAAGLAVVLDSKKRSAVITATKDTDDISVIFSGSETSNKSHDYKGGRVTSIFGGASIDLRDAKIKKQATLDVFTLFGGVEIRVPREWKVVSKVTPIAGGVENKAHGDESHDGPVLILTGSATFGGIEIKT